MKLGSAVEWRVEELSQIVRGDLAGGEVIREKTCQKAELAFKERLQLVECCPNSVPAGAPREGVLRDAQLLCKQLPTRMVMIFI